MVHLTLTDRGGGDLVLQKAWAADVRKHLDELLFMMNYGREHGLTVEFNIGMENSAFMLKTCKIAQTL